MQVTIEDITRIISLQLGNRNVSGEDHFLEDLGAESFDVMNIVIAIEDKFGVVIKDADVPNLLTPAALFQFVQDHL
jgi:acyl carrier protein